MKNRGSGILCHISSLPSPFGIGDLGPNAYAFADFLEETRQSYWQILPLNPTSATTSYSPYSCISAMAGNPLLISPELLLQEELLTKSDVSGCPPFSECNVDYRKLSQYKRKIFSLARTRFFERGEKTDISDYQRFCEKKSEWLGDFALFSAIYGKFGFKPIPEWPSGIKNRKDGDLREISGELREEVEYEKFLQYLFFRQWGALKNYCNSKGILVIGDFPFFMGYDAADVWAHPQYFKLDKDKKPAFIAGSPPDSFSEKGQLFNCVVYDWDALQKDGFSWWVQRFNSLFALYDIVRVDHFRGLVAYWETPAGETNAKNGKWQPARYYEFMKTMLKYFPALPIIAEDLGMITADVREAMHSFGFPGIKMLLFGFAKEMYENAFLPHNHIENCVVYTGTHDTDTCRGWFDRKDNQEDKERFFSYVGREMEAEDVAWEFVKLALMSVAKTAIVPIQDLLGLGSEARMNTPGKADNNWLWRLQTEQLTPRVRNRLREMTELYERC